MLRDRLGKDLLLFDGAMGTQLQAAGLAGGEYPEEYNILHPDIITDIHRRYLEAGADFITTNTFGCNPLKMADSQFKFDDMIRRAVKNAQEARQRVNHDAYIILDIGPIGQMLRPLGPLSFDQAYDIIAAQVNAAKDMVDGVLLETLSDLYEVKAGILAVKENCDLPLFVTMTFQDDGRTLTGTDPLTFVNVACGLGVDVLGVNCSLGPAELRPIVKTLLENSPKPVMIQPNAGLPHLHNGQTVYLLSEADFTRGMNEFIQGGAAVVGGCCGTTPRFITELKKILPAHPVKTDVPHRTMVSGRRRTVTFGDNIVVCGERMNPTGRKSLQAALREGNFSRYVAEAVLQEQAGADILDLNVGLPGIDEKQAMKTVMQMVTETVSLPLQIDSSDPDVLSRACRYYNGKPLINSVNGKDRVMDAVFPLVKKYGGVVIGLTMEDGIPAKAQERLAIAEKIIRKAESYGIPKEDIIIDCLTLTASARQSEVIETVKAVKLIKEKLGVYTVLGVSNVSFGLPNRPLLNRTFLSLALGAGLDMPIINPMDTRLLETVSAYKVLADIDKESTEYIASQSGAKSVRPAGSGVFTLEEIIIHGLKDGVKERTRTELLNREPMSVINDVIIPALNKVGDEYEKGRIFLPQLIAAAETTKQAFRVVKDAFPAGGRQKGPVMICTVEGDVHDIGKNIVKVVLESYGWLVIDLGKDVKVEDVLAARQKYNPVIIGLSALMTTTVVNMERTIKALKEAGITCPVWVGGAVLTQKIADDIGADYYTADAMESVKLLERLFN